jgi:hypothetical protein
VAMKDQNGRGNFSFLIGESHFSLVSSRTIAAIILLAQNFDRRILSGAFYIARTGFRSYFYNV